MPNPPVAESAHRPRFGLGPHVICPNLVGVALITAVDADVLSHQDAHLNLAFRVAGVSLRQATQWHEFGYEPAKKRSQRAGSRWVAGWLPDSARISRRSERQGAA
jgi:hypothetical protein